jgi:hypothetical protein
MIELYSRRVTANVDVGIPKLVEFCGDQVADSVAPLSHLAATAIIEMQLDPPMILLLETRSVEYLRQYDMVLLWLRARGSY